MEEHPAEADSKAGVVTDTEVMTVAHLAPCRVPMQGSPHPEVCLAGWQQLAGLSLAAATGRSPLTLSSG